MLKILPDTKIFKLTGEFERFMMYWVYPLRVYPTIKYVFHIYLAYINTYMLKYTCLLVSRGVVGHTLLGSHPWKTLSGCIQLDRNKFTCFRHSIDWSSTYIKDLVRVDSIFLGVSQQQVIEVLSNGRLGVGVAPKKTPFRGIFCGKASHLS